MILDILYSFFQNTIILYSVGILVSYLLISLISYTVVRKYIHKRTVLDHRSVVSSPYQPSLSIIAPAYNEAVTIVDNIRSLLSLHYSKLTIIIVNDGSKDDTLQMAIDNYDLVLSDIAYDMNIPTKGVRGIYKSRKKAFTNLIVVDKHNGGKADAINVGINIAQSDYFACIDVDCIIDQDAFLRLVEPIMREKKKRVVAVGGIVWLTNDAEIRQGKLIRLKAPETYIGRIQVIEYFRAFLLGRPAWASPNGLLLISGAFGIFHRASVLEVGGYNHATVGEDMELVMRLHVHCRASNVPYKVVYLPDPLCWTEAPSSFAVLGRQRNRWTRGTIECLKIHKKMFCNPKYGILGLVSYPYWMVAEWFAPYVEVGGLVFFFIAALFGFANWPFFFSLLFMIYCFAILISFFAIFAQEMTFKRYESVADIFALAKTALLEPIYYHPRTVWWSMKGNYDHFTGSNKGWGEMTRAGFKKKAA